MNAKLALIIFICTVATVSVWADEYFWLGERQCDSRCDITSRMNPFAPSCDDCCRRGGFSKGKCKGFGWQYCMCKQSMGNRLLNSLLNG